MEPLSYDAFLSLPQASEKLREVQDAFDSVRKKYGALDEIVAPRIAPVDKKTLERCFGVLLPLGHQQSVQEELFSSAKREETVHQHSALLLSDIMVYLSRFPNTGVKLVGYVDPREL